MILFKNLQFILILFEKSRLELPEQKEKASQIAPIEFDCNFLFKLRFIEKKKALRRLQLLMTQCGGGGGGGGVILPVISKTYKSFLRGISLPFVPCEAGRVCPTESAPRSQVILRTYKDFLRILKVNCVSANL